MLEPSKIEDLINENQLYWLISWRESYYWKFIYLEMLIEKENIHDLNTFCYRAKNF